MDFKKGDYVILLKSYDGRNCWIDQMPENYCYRLRENFYKNRFTVELDIKGNKYNGYSSAAIFDNNKIEIRLATETEIEFYKFLGKPYSIHECVGYNFTKIHVNLQTIINYVNNENKRFN